MMNQNKMVMLVLTKLGVRPSYKGYPYLVSIIGIASKLPAPVKLGDLYAQTALGFDVTPQTVQHNIRTVLKAYWNSGHTEKLSEITGYPVEDILPPKEFIYLIAEYVSRNS